MKIHRFLCFGRSDNSGNSAVVVENSRLAEAERLRFAQQQNASATVFMETSETSETDSASTSLDYYYPHTRSPLCLHATLAASALFFELYPDRNLVQFVTRMHRQALVVKRISRNFLIGVSARPCPQVSIDVTQAARLLGVAPSALTGAPQLASVGSPKLLVQITQRAALDSLRPELAAIGAWSREHGVSGLYAYCQVHDDVYAGRNFNHLDPHLEDAATGVAAGALALTLKKSLTLLQGDTLGQPCSLEVRYSNGAVQVGGRATRNVI